VDAVTFTDAEERIYNEIGNSVHGSFEVKSIARECIDDIFDDTDNGVDPFFKVKIESLVFNEDSGKEKKTTLVYYIREETAQKALKYAEGVKAEFLNGATIKSVVETKITDLFRFVPAS